MTTPHDHVADGTAVGFLTDATLCIGCKACEVACKEWNGLPSEGDAWLGLSYDQTGELGASTWRHVKFLERSVPRGGQVAGTEPFSWVFLSDVCKHCEEAGCLEACPTGAIVRTEVGSVLVQDDVCNGCGYCVVACPFGVIDRRHAPADGAQRSAQAVDGTGGAFKCTFCYDRQAAGLIPACAKVCPTESIRFGPLAELEAEAERRLEDLHGRGYADARVYDARGTSVRGVHALSILLGEPADWGLPPAPEAPTVHLGPAWRAAGWTMLGALAATLALFLGLGG